LELSNYFQTIIFNQKTAAPRRFRSGPGASRAPPLLRYWSYTWWISSHWEILLYSRICL